MFQKLLIANRGEIACRIIKTAARLGVATVAVYSEADADALHVRRAHEAIGIGPSPARASYLDIDKLIAAASQSGADAVHPGYGFLAENATFAEACAGAGITFVGPPVEAIRAMGSKSLAKDIMTAAGVPVVPGYYGEDQSTVNLQSQADQITYPVLIKATAGGGGKGVRIVEHAGEFENALGSAKREAASAFGDDRVLIEKYLINPRHIEFQIFCDHHGGAVHLFERDCSLQRRYQKVIEESPAPDLPSELRNEMGLAAIDAARSVHYRNAGTVEFILAGDRQFYFMEMNTRLQVEHPVTELVTGQGLVEWQLRIAAGEPLPLEQQDISVHGHAVEARLYAEDPNREFLPATGKLTYLGFPDGDPQVRIDTGVAGGDTIGMHYDPMIAKLSAWGEDRHSALQRLSAAVRGTQIAGLTTNQGFLGKLLDHPRFRQGPVATSFIDNEIAALLPDDPRLDDNALACACLYILQTQDSVRQLVGADPHSPWSLCNGWRLNAANQQIVSVRHNDVEIEITVEILPAGYVLLLPEGPVRAHAELRSEGEMLVNLNDWQRVARVIEADRDLTVFFDDRQHRFTRRELVTTTDTAGAGTLRAPMPGTVIAVMVEDGARVTRGTPLMILEAMKMEHTIAAPADGVVSSVHFGVGDLVPKEGVELLVIDAESPD